MGAKPFPNLSLNFWFLFFLSFTQPLLAEAPSQSLPPEVVTRFQQMEHQIAELQSQITQLKSQVEVKAPEGKTIYLPPSEAAGPQWLDGLEMGGDLRLRYEAFDQNEATRDRNRFRYRLRWKTEKHLTKDLDLGFRIVSGTATDPTSPLQTFTGDFTPKSIFIDQAYAKYRPSFLVEQIPSLEKIEIGGGKLENPFFEASGGLLWDADAAPEGFYESFRFGLFDKRINPFIHLGQFILQENATSVDAELYGIQSGIRWSPQAGEKAANLQLTHALGYYDYSDYARDSNFIVSGTSLARGNTAAGTILAAGDFDILQVYNEIKLKVGAFPVKIFSDFFTNLADRAPDPLGRNVGYQYGLRLGDAKKKGTWDALYYYGYVEPNATVGAFADSDFGLGHANKRGNTFKLGYKLTDSMKVGLAAYFVNNVTGADDETRRFQTDLEWVF